MPPQPHFGGPAARSWLRERQPDVKIGKSIWLYEVSPAEAAAWAGR